MRRTKTTARAARRARARTQGKLVRDLERLARLAPGGSPERPVALESPAQVEVVAAARPCPLCGGSLRVDTHTASTSGGLRRRVAQVACTACGIRRALYFVLREGLH